MNDTDPEHRREHNIDTQMIMIIALTTLSELTGSHMWHAPWTRVLET